MPDRLPLTVNLKPFGGGEVRLGDRDISNTVRGIHIDAAAGQLTEITLDLCITEITHVVDAEPRYHLGTDVHDALVALGWTPPADA